MFEANTNPSNNLHNPQRAFPSEIVATYHYVRRVVPLDLAFEQSTNITA